jgi:hypothetical protein
LRRSIPQQLRGSIIQLHHNLMLLLLPPPLLIYFILQPIQQLTFAARNLLQNVTKNHWWREIEREDHRLVLGFL